MHLTDRNVQELAYAYNTNVLLSDEQVEWKRHMADCDSCFGKFLTEKTLQETLLQAGLINRDMLQEAMHPVNEVKEKVLLTIEKAADGWKMLAGEIQDKLAAMWNFYPAPQFAMSRGTQESSPVAIYENGSSEYSMIQIDENGLLIRLDAEDYDGGNLMLKVTKDSSVNMVKFLYNEDEECYDAFVRGEVTPDMKFEIITHYQNDEIE